MIPSQPFLLITSSSLGNFAEVDAYSTQHISGLSVGNPPSQSAQSTMQNKGLRRFQLLLLLIVVVLIIWRMSASPSGSGFVSIENVEKRDFETRHFEVYEPVMVTIDGEVSFEDDRARADLAVVSWILNEEGNVVWRTDSDNVHREGVRATVADSVRLDPGEYSLYYSALGPDRYSYRGGSAFGLKPHWTNYEEFWYLDLIAPEKTVGLSGPFRQAAASNALFEMGLSERRSSKRMMIHVSGLASLNASGGFTRCTVDCDEITIKEIPDGIVIWSVDNEEAEQGGGSQVNHWLDTEIELTGGVYEIAFHPGRHEGRWSENPPWRPEDFVFTMNPSGTGSIRPVDPWAFGQPLVDHLGLGDSELAESRIVVEDSLDIILYAMGEMTSSNQRYDWGWIEREGGGELIWEMTYDESSPAGGDSDNRAAKAILRLGPGSYVASFRTDGSHSYQSFNRSRPNNPERWGMAIFPLDPDQVEAAGVSVERIERAEPAPAPEPDQLVGSSLEDIDGSRFLVRSTRLGNNADVTSDFTLTDSTRVVIAALGEITSTTQYDYGWIENVATGERIWEMTWDRTSPAGGDDSYRSVREEIMLAPGSYRSRFRTDGSISFEGYGSDFPDHPEDWGIAIFRADS